MFTNTLNEIHIYWWYFVHLYLPTKSLYGAVLPFCVSVVILIWYAKSFARLPKIMLLSIMAISIIIAHYLSFWNNAGYHIPPVIAVLLIGYALWQRRIFKPAMAYPIVYFSLLVVDVTGAGQAENWSPVCWLGVGGYGFADGLFLQPLLGILLMIPILSLLPSTAKSTAPAVSL